MFTMRWTETSEIFYYRSIPTSSCYIHKNSHRKSVEKNQNRFEFTRMNVKSLIYCLYLILSILPKQMIILRSLWILRQMVLNHVVFLCCLQWMRTRKILSFLFRCNIRVISLSLFFSIPLCNTCISLSDDVQSVLAVAFCLCSIAICIRRKFGSLALFICVFVCVFFSPDSFVVYRVQSLSLSLPLIFSFVQVSQKCQMRIKWSCQSSSSPWV